MKKAMKIHVFYCSRVFDTAAAILSEKTPRWDIRAVPMACSGMVKDIFLLKAFESGADAVTVWVCPEGACRHGEGNLRAGKRVERVRTLLDAIKMNGNRLSFFNVPHRDAPTALKILEGITAQSPIREQHPQEFFKNPSMESMAVRCT